MNFVISVSNPTIAKTTFQDQTKNQRVLYQNLKQAKIKRWPK